ncbi:MAG: hypothetical protein IPL26_13185 [Leptospiraceae bacterium]|nr:hypothetical protein [Leptospiraceae bacterium]
MIVTNSAIETLLLKIKDLWQEIYTSGKDEFAMENIIRFAQIREHEAAIRELQ